MFSTEKCSRNSRSGSPDETENFAGGDEDIAKEGTPSDEVVSAVDAVAVKIGDILKDELRDADKAARIGAELADLSAELGRLAGLTESEQESEYPSLFEIAMGHRGSVNASSSTSTTSSSRSDAARRPPRPIRMSRRKCIGKQGRELTRRRAALGLRVVSLRMARIEVMSDASDVGASDSDDQWTEFDDGSSSDNSSAKETQDVAEIDSSEFKQKDQLQGPEAPPMGQFLLPLLSCETSNAVPPEQFLIRHEDILQLLASAEESARSEMIEKEDVDERSEQHPMLTSAELFSESNSTVTPEEEAALLHYVCEAERTASSDSQCGWSSVEEWLMGAFHSWCEMHTIISTSINGDVNSTECVDWGRFPCHCSLCLSVASCDEALSCLAASVLTALTHEPSTLFEAARLRKAFQLRAGAELEPNTWQLPSSAGFSDAAASIIHEQLVKASQVNDMSRDVIRQVCICRPFEKPFEKEYAVERLLRIFESYKVLSTVEFKLEFLSPDDTKSTKLAITERRQSNNLPTSNTTKTLLANCVKVTPKHHITAWAAYKHRCDCVSRRTMCESQRKELLRLSFFGIMQMMNELNSKTGSATDSDKEANGLQPQPVIMELQQGDGTGAKPPDASNMQLVQKDSTELDFKSAGEYDDDDDEDDDDDDEDDDDDDDDDDEDDCDDSPTCRPPSDPASSLLLAAAAVSSGSSSGALCRSVRRLMRAIVTVERLMDNVLTHCDRLTDEARKRVDMGLSEIDRKLMAMYRRLPEVHRKQLQVYRKQKKLSVICSRLLAARAPPPPPPGSPPAPPPAAPALLHYHLLRFREVRRKVMHMRDQQLYYHRLRIWLEDQLKQERDRCEPDNNMAMIEELPKSKHNSGSPNLTQSKIKLYPQTISNSQKIIQMLKSKHPHAQLCLDINDDDKSEAEAPEAFHIEKDSDTDTIVGERDTEICKEMKECLAKFANFALNNPEELDMEYDLQDNEYPEALSPPLQEMSPTATESMPVYTPNPSQRLLTFNKLLAKNKNDFGKVDFDPIVPDINVPLNARRPSLLIEDEKDITIEEIDNSDSLDKDRNMYKYIPFGIEIKKAMEECQNIINSHSCVQDEFSNKSDVQIEELCEAMINIDKKSDFLEKIDSDDDISEANSKLAKLVENMPQILANMPEFNINKVSEFENALIELPEFASIMKDLPDVNSEAQLTPETLKQIRELKLIKTRDSVKVTKNTTKRKANRKTKNVDNDNRFNNQKKNYSSVLKHVKEDDSNEARDSSLPEDLCDRVLKGEYFTLNNVFFCLLEVAVTHVNSMTEFRTLIEHEFNRTLHLYKSEAEKEQKHKLFNSYVLDIAKQRKEDIYGIVEKIEDLRLKEFRKEEGCAASEESLKQISKLLLSSSTGTFFDLIIMKLIESKMSNDKQTSEINYIAESLNFKYIDIINRCIESHDLTIWVLTDPDVALTVIQELAKLPPIKAENLDYTMMTNEMRMEYFIIKLRELNASYIESIPKDGITNIEKFILIYKLEEMETRLKECVSNLSIPKPNQSIISETNENSEKSLTKVGSSDSDVILKSFMSGFECVLKCTGEKLRNDCYFTIKNHVNQGVPIPDSIKKDIESACGVEANVLDEIIDDTIEKDEKCNSYDENDSGNSSASCCNKDKTTGSTLSKSQIDEMCRIVQAKHMGDQLYDALCLRYNANKKSQSVSESDTSDTKPDCNMTPGCNMTPDCTCESCKIIDKLKSFTDVVNFCSDVVKYDENIEKKPVPKVTKALPAPVPPKPENVSHQQHVCKIGHSTGPCSAEGNEPCTCCYCTVFGHAPQMTTPVPRNFNETRERLRSILNKKKQKCKTINKEQEVPEKKAVVTPQRETPPNVQQIPKPKPNVQQIPKPKPNVQQIPKPKPNVQQIPKPKPNVQQIPKPKPNVQQIPKPKPNVQQLPKPKPVVPSGKPPALPKTLPPSLPITKTEIQDQQLTEKMARMNVSDTPDVNKAKALQKTIQVQVNIPKPIENKIHAIPVEQVRQQSKPVQNKPEPIYEVPHRHEERKPQSGPKCTGRDSSVYSTSSSDMATEDPRDLDALLKYIEGPTMQVDRVKKKAKKQRQRVKKIEARLLEERALLATNLLKFKNKFAFMKKSYEPTIKKREQLKNVITSAGTKKGKKLNLEKTEVQKIMQTFNDNELETEKVIKNAETYVAQLKKKLKQCDKTIIELRRSWAEELEPQGQNQKQQKKGTETKQQVDQLNQRRPVMELPKLDGAIITASPDGSVRVRRADLPPSVTSRTSVTSQADAPAAKFEKKHTWEQALAHMTALAGADKEKKKKEKPKVEVKPVKKQVPVAPPVPEQPLNKKQRKALAKQLAEEEAKRIEQEANRVKTKAEKKKEAKNEKKAKNEVPKKDEKVDNKNDKKAKEKTEKNAQNNQKATKQKQQPTPQPAPQPTTKKEKKKNNQKAQVINITPHTTIELVNNNKNPCNNIPNKPASCSIMEQLSCGVQVADLKLPPGITLTRVQPSEKKEPPHIKSVPIWKCNQLAATPTPIPRPPPVINADPSMMMFTTAPMEQPKTIIIPEPAQPQPGKSKKAKKKAKKAAANQEKPVEKKPDGTKMVTLRNPMFHPNLPPVQINAIPEKKIQPKAPEQISLPQNPCQATITPTSNGMYTIRNPLMSMMHQQSLVGLRAQTPQPTMYPPNYNYVNPNVYPKQAYVVDPSRSSPKNLDDARIINLASFTQKNDDGYSLFKTNDENQQNRFLNENFYEEQKPTVSPNPIGTRPNETRSFEDSLFTNNSINRPEIGQIRSEMGLLRPDIGQMRPEVGQIRPEVGQIGQMRPEIGQMRSEVGQMRTEMKENDDYVGLYTPFGQEDRNVFRNALFEKDVDTNMTSNASNGDMLPYFQRLRAGSRLNNEVTIHHVTESKFYKGQEPIPQHMDVNTKTEDTLFSYPSKSWTPGFVTPSTSNSATSVGFNSKTGSPPPNSLTEDDVGYGAVGAQRGRDPHIYLQERGMNDANSERTLEVLRRYEQMYSHRLHNLNTN